MDSLIHKFARLYPSLTFVAGNKFYWSPKDQTIFYKLDLHPIYRWKLLHEVGHALLDHQSYQNDFELLKLEVAAWDKAEDLARDFKIEINGDYIQDCLDTYRDWLHKRSTCPACGTRSLQEAADRYKCFNCATTWHVSPSRFCRTYRQTHRSNKKSPVIRQAIFS